jgi:hypothetical protein
MIHHKAFAASLLFLFSAARLLASYSGPKDADHLLTTAGAVFRGTATDAVCYRNPADGLIYTRTTFRVNEVFKGRFGATVTVIQRGGEINGLGFSDDASPKFPAGEEVVLCLSQRRDGTLYATDGHDGTFRLRRNNGALKPDQQDFLKRLRGRPNTSGLNLTGQASGPLPVESISAPSGDSSGASTNGMLIDSFGVPHRFPLPDEGLPIPYLVDATFLPTGITLTNALIAVSNALAAWSSASSVRFMYAGTANFGTTSAAINNNDGAFRIQLHDFYNFIPPGSIVGEGGAWFNVGLLPNANWGSGGNVAGQEFNLSVNGYVVLKHTNVFMQNITNFTEVLTHEIGHVLGLAHSSEVTTNNATLTNSIMYYQAHGDGRGASLNSYDTNVVRQVHPINTPPWTYPRVMDITTASVAPNVAGINSVELRGYDLQGTNLTLSVTNLTTFNGTFTNIGSLIKYACPNYPDSDRIDPATTSYYDALNARISDGTNASPYVYLRVVSYNNDSNAISDGIPDAWMTANFGHTAPGAGDKSRASDDADGDKLTNLQEYIAGMNPTSAASAQRIISVSANSLQFQAKPYELYEVLGNTNLAATNGWVRTGVPVLPTNSIGVATNLYNAALPRQFFRILKVP